MIIAILIKGGSKRLEWSYVGGNNKVILLFVYFISNLNVPKTSFLAFFLIQTGRKRKEVRTRAVSWQAGLGRWRKLPVKLGSEK